MREQHGRSLDPTAIRQLLEVTGGDAAFLDELLQAFLDGAAAQMADLQQAVADGSVEDMVRPAHSLKGNGANIGAGRLVELAGGLEADARNGSVGDAAARVAAVAAELEIVKTELDPLRRGS